MHIIRSFVFAPFERYNRIRIAGKDRASAVGLMELDEEAVPFLITRLDLRFAGLFAGETGHTVSGFLRLAQPFKLPDGPRGHIKAEIEAFFGVALTDPDLSYIHRPIRLSVDLLYEGCSLTGSIEGKIPEEFPFDPGADFSLPLQGTSDGFGRLRASFDPREGITGVRLTVASRGWCKTIQNPRSVDMLIPSHSTLMIDWERREENGKVHRERDIMADVILAPGQSTDLAFSLFPPGVVPVLGAVILAQERDAEAKMDYRLIEHDNGEVTIETVIEGKPGRFVLIDLVVASNDPARANPTLSRMGYFGTAAVGALPISCNMKDPGGPTNPGSDPILSNPPGGGGGAPESPDPPSTPGPSSSTSDGGNTCDANYGVVIPPIGSLTLSTRVKPIGPENTEIALVGVFRASHRLVHGRAELLPEGGTPCLRRFNPLWIVTPGRHALRVDVPTRWTLRELVRYELMVDTTDRLITSLTLHAPEEGEVATDSPLVLADMGHGIGFAILDSMAGKGGLYLRLRNLSGGWIGLPGRQGNGKEITIFGRCYTSHFVPAGVEDLNIPA